MIFSFYIYVLFFIYTIA